MRGLAWTIDHAISEARLTFDILERERRQAHSIALHMVLMTISIPLPEHERQAQEQSPEQVEAQARLKKMWMLRKNRGRSCRTDFKLRMSRLCSGSARPKYYGQVDAVHYQQVYAQYHAHDDLDPTHHAWPVRVQEMKQCCAIPLLSVCPTREVTEVA